MTQKFPQDKKYVQNRTNSRDFQSTRFRSSEPFNGKKAQSRQNRGNGQNQQLPMEQQYATVVETSAGRKGLKKKAVMLRRRSQMINGKNQWNSSEKCGFQNDSSQEYYFKNWTFEKRNESFTE